MFLRPGIRENLAGVLREQGLEEIVLGAFEGGPFLKSGRIAGAQYLPKNRRQRGYAALMALGSEHGITVRISAMTNPDFQPPRTPRTELPSLRQQSLPLFLS
jgi:hypothetical protein